MKRSFGKRAALVFWAVGSCGAVLFSCFMIFVVIQIIVQTRKVSSVALAMFAGGIFLAWEGFKIFKTERKSN
jgi:threonine/homoserine/homoserine lactone efflux protein